MAATRFEQAHGIEVAKRPIQTGDYAIVTRPFVKEIVEKLVDRPGYSHRSVQIDQVFKGLVAMTPSEARDNSYLAGTTRVGDETFPVVIPRVPVFHLKGVEILEDNPGATYEDWLKQNYEAWANGESFPTYNEWQIANGASCSFKPYADLLLDPAHQEFTMTHIDSHPLPVLESNPQLLATASAH